MIERIGSETMIDAQVAAFLPCGGKIPKGEAEMNYTNEGSKPR